MDLYEPIERGLDFDDNSWDYEKCPNLQDSRNSICYSPRVLGWLSRRSVS